MSIIDTPANTTAKLACLKSKGVTTVIRYYNFTNSPQLPDKRLDPPEAQALAANGMQIAVVFQQRQNSASRLWRVHNRGGGRRSPRVGRNNGCASRIAKQNKAAGDNGDKNRALSQIPHGDRQ